MQKSKFFTLEELLRSDTAKRRGIENFPSFEVVEHLNELALSLDGIREAWGSGIRVNSGYRCSVLNIAVGGVPTSVHKLGFAADIYPVNGKWEEFKRFIVEYLKDKKFDQCILESAKGRQWIHYGLYSNSHQQRCKIFSISK